MNYQELYKKYQGALKMRELSVDNNYNYLRDAFQKKIMSNINLSAQDRIIMYLAGIKEVFSFVEDESNKVDDYREQLDTVFAEQNG